MLQTPSRQLPSIRTLGALALLTALSLGLTGCAHDRHTGAVIGGVVGATIGYVIASESEHKDYHRHDRHAKRIDPYHHGHHPRRTGYHPPRHDPYCK
ncbi:MAG: hypothetical protein AAF911_11055 [Planctomycetota bacterium]